MMDGRFEESVQLVYPCTEEFTHKIKDMDPSIDVGSFIEITRSLVSLKLKKPGPDATPAQIKAYENNVDHLVAVEVAHCPHELHQKYLNMRNDNKAFRAHEQRMNELANRFVTHAGMEEIPLGPEIDQSKRNGMTLLGDAIVSMKPLEDIQDLVETKGASPDAPCGKTTPVELALQLGRGDVASYLTEMVKFQG